MGEGETERKKSEGRELGGEKEGEGVRGRKNRMEMVSRKKREEGNSRIVKDKGEKDEEWKNKIKIYKKGGYENKKTQSIRNRKIHKPHT